MCAQDNSTHGTESYIISSTLNENQINIGQSKQLIHDLMNEDVVLIPVVNDQ